MILLLLLLLALNATVDVSIAHIYSSNVTFDVTVAVTATYI